MAKPSEITTYFVRILNQTIEDKLISFQREYQMKRKCSVVPKNKDTSAENIKLTFKDTILVEILQQSPLDNTSMNRIIADGMETALKEVLVSLANLIGI